MSDENPFASPQPAPLPTDAPELETPQTLTYRPRCADHLVGCKHAFAESPELRAATVINLPAFLVAGVVATALGSLTWTVAPEYGELGASVAIAGGALLVGALLRLPTRRMYFLRYNEERFIIDFGGAEAPEHTIGLQPDYLLVKHGDQSHRYFWRQVRSVARLDEHLLILLRDWSPVTIPLDAFSSPAQFVGWAKLAERLWREAQPDYKRS